MTGFASMAERHAFGLEMVEEMTGKLLQAAFLRAQRSDDPEDRDRATLLFDRLARGYRLTVGLEARMDRDRRRDAGGLPPEEPAAERAAQDRPGRTSPHRLREGDHEEDRDLEPADLPGHIQGLRRMVAEDADILDPDGAHADTLDRWTGSKLYDVVETGPPEPALARPALKFPPRRSSAARRRATGPPDR